MYVKRVHVKNFRSIRNCSVDLGNHTAILGGNGAGKSTVLRAIDRFYAPSGNVELDDFFGRRTGDPIEIGLTFSGLNAAEQALFGSRVHGGEMSVVRIFEAEGGRTNGRYFGLSLQCSSFLAIRAITGAREKTTAYNELKRLEPARYREMPAVTRADQVDDALAQWEADNPDQCELYRDNGQFFGFSNVARGSLQKFTSFVFIPAVRDASADAIDAKGAVIARLMELVVRNAIQKRGEIVAFQENMGAEYRRLTDPARLTELGGLSDDLTGTLQRFYLEAAVNLQWQEMGDFAVPLPSAEVMLNDDGFEGPVDRKGHGLQRAFILTLLQHLARASAEASAAQEAEGAEEDREPEEQEADGAPAPGAPPPAAFVLPGLILAIEEPELYQHPTKQRHFAKVLQQLSEGALPGVAAQTQVVFASHSSLFVSAGKFDEIRLARRRACADVAHKECILSSSTLEAVCRRLERMFLEEEGARSVEGLRSRLHVLGPELAEGFFADMVVLVEGASDRAALVATAQVVGYDLEANGIAILPVRGKTGLYNPACIFKELSIPTYAIWDCDRGSRDPKDDLNLALQRMCGAADDDLVPPSTKTSRKFSCFEIDLEHTLKDEIGADVFDGLLDSAVNVYGLQQRADAAKSPAAMIDVLTAAAANGHQSPTLLAIILALQALREESNQASCTIAPEAELAA